jgi:phage repressor protein C with HTH and peptisase S24 domain
MDAARTIIVAKVAELGLSLSELSLSVGKNHAYFQQFIKRGVPARLPEEVRGRVAEILKIDERTLKLGAAKPSPAAPGSNAHVGGAVRITTWIPVYGQAVGGKDGEFVLNGNQASEVLAPSTLAGVPGAYAVYVVGSSMEPRYFEGETVYVNPRLPVNKGAFVVAQISGGAEDDVPHAFVKRFVSQDARRIKLEQYNPKKILEFPAAKVVSIHRIIMCGEHR